GFISRNRLNGILAVTRAFGDINFKKHPAVMQGELWEKQQLISKPEITSVGTCIPVWIEVLEYDSFLILACDGIWDVITSQQAVSFVQRRLMAHSDVQRVSREVI
ncbi:unnamed protein product, partial [Discosporangium mesarthrocarpum]